MPVYRYKHNETPCDIGESFEIEQPMRDNALKQCPKCGGAIHRVVVPFHISTPTGDSDYKSMGFTKLVKRDDGVYENVTRTGKESRYMEAGKPETMPDLKKKIGD